MAVAEFDGRRFRLDAFTIQSSSSDWESLLDTLEPGQLTVSGQWELGGDYVSSWTVPPHVPFRLVLPYRRQGWLPQWEVVEYSHEPDRPLARTAHRRWWFVSYTLVRWWLRRHYRLGPKGGDGDG